MATQYGKPWQRDELVLALYLYCQIPFARTKANNPQVIELANVLRRTPASVARKLGNFGAFDPRLAERGIKGLVHASKADRMVWEEFSDDWEALVEQANELLTHKGARSAQSDEDVICVQRKTTETETTRETRIRLGQDFFRRAVMSSYQSRCCITRIEIPGLLIASHIVPWAQSKEERVNPQNGLCLCVLFDKAFDHGLMTLDPDFHILISQGLLDSDNEFISASILPFAGQRIELPTRFAPRRDLLAWHNRHVFVG